MTRKIGILGGTFDPFHKGHFMLAKTAYEQFALDEVWIMPNGNPPHKREIQQTPLEIRSEMIRRAIDKVPYMVLCEHESSETSYHFTYQTLSEFQELYPEDQFYFIIGADSLWDFPTWRKPEVIAGLCTLLVACRDEAGILEIRQKIRELEERYQAKCLIMNSPKVDAASSEIRQMVSEGKDVSCYVGEEVFAYLKQQKLYGAGEKGVSMVEYDLKALQKKMKEELSEDRFEHTLGVMYTAESLAMCYGADMTKAAVAGLLHDCAKCIPNTQKIKLCKKNGLEITPMEEKNPSLLHAKLGAYLAEKTYGVEDPEILSAIRWHTTGKPEMSLLDMIIYLADYIEPNRDKAPDLKKIRKLCFENIEEALYEVLEGTLGYLSKRPEMIDPMTRNSYEFYQEKLKK